MFFYIGNECELLNKVHDKLFLDKGWTQVLVNESLTWYKGYSTECSLENSIQPIITGYKPKGLWCVISVVDNQYKVYYPDLCSFPFNGYSNLYDNVNQVIDVSLLDTTNSFDSVVTNVISILSDTFIGYHQYNADMLNIWCTGGLDSILFLALCEKTKTPYNLYVDKTHSSTNAEYTSDLTRHVATEFSNYAFMSRFTEKTVLGTGYGGDSSFCRHPEQIKIFANSLGLSAYDVVKSTHYVYPFLKRTIVDDAVNSMLVHETAEEIKKRILHGISQWFYVWHLDNTFTFNPFIDLDLAKMVLTLSINELLDASLDGSIQKEAIRKCDPTLMCLLDDQKNTLSSGKNLINNLDRVNLSCCKKIFIV